MKLADAKTPLERAAHAETCARDLRFTIPILIDDLDDRAARAYGAYPDRLYLLGEDGRVVYRGGPGPRGFDPDRLEEALEKHLASRPKGPPRRLRV